MDLNSENKVFLAMHVSKRRPVSGIGKSCRNDVLVRNDATSNAIMRSKGDRQKSLGQINGN